MNFAVAPYMGAWIEIADNWSGENLVLSLPTLERGLKFCRIKQLKVRLIVAPYMERGLKSSSIGLVDARPSGTLPTWERPIEI